jgi:hypothetical protein
LLITPEYEISVLIGSNASAGHQWAEEYHAFSWEEEALLGQQQRFLLQMLTSFESIQEN